MEDGKGLWKHASLKVILFNFLWVQLLWNNPMYKFGNPLTWVSISGTCPKGYFSCHSCCEPSEDDLCKCDKNKGAIAKTIYRPSEYI